MIVYSHFLFLLVVIRSLSQTRMQVGQVLEAKQSYLRVWFSNRQNQDTLVSNHLKFLEETMTPIISRKNIGVCNGHELNLISMLLRLILLEIFSPNFGHWVISAFF